MIEAMLKLLGFACLLLATCNNHQLEKNFFKQSRQDRIVRLRQYSLEDQYKIFRYGYHRMGHPHPDLAIPIAERGASAVPFLTEQLKSNSDDATLHDVLVILAEMKQRKTFYAGQDSTLIQYLVERVAKMKIDTGYIYDCRLLMEDIKVVPDTP